MALDAFVSGAVLLLTNTRLNVAKKPIRAALFTGNYREQLTWRDAATGRLLAAPRN